VRELIRGNIPTLILSVLVGGPCHGYAIGRRIEQLSENALRLREGALYPALRVLEQDGFIAGRWEAQIGVPSRKVYEITSAGHAELARRTSEWRQYVRIVGKLIGGQPNAETA
jgi:PadR family transcriptional regulator, regulatory protein PadR